MEVDPEYAKLKLRKLSFKRQLVITLMRTRTVGISSYALTMHLVILTTILFVTTPISAQPCVQIAALSTTCNPSGDALTSFEITNLAGLTVHSVLFSGEVQLPNGSTVLIDPISIIFDPTLANGATQTVVITLRDASPGDIVEVPFALLHQDDFGVIVECCSDVLTITIPDPCGLLPFIRGDANLDATLNIADPVTVLAHLFSGADLLCQSAADGNDDGVTNIADAISLLGWIFGGTLPPPPAPFPECGQDPTPDTLDCLENLSCP